MMKWGCILVTGSFGMSSTQVDLLHSKWVLPSLLVSIRSHEVLQFQWLTFFTARDRTSLDDVAILAICCSAGIFATTIHTQDFKDVIGDAAVGRRTLPITQPNFARLTVPVVLTLWSIGLGYTWHLGWYTALAFVTLACVTSARFFFLRTIPQDKNSFYYWYNVSCLLSTLDTVSFDVRIRFGCRQHMHFRGIIDTTMLEYRNRG